MPRPAVTPPPPPAAAHLAALRQRLDVIPEDGVQAARGTAAPAAMMVSGYRFAGPQQPGWHALSERRMAAGARPGILALTRLMLAADDDPLQRAGLEVYETRSHEAARDLLLELLTGFELLPGRIPMVEGSDHAALGMPNGRVHLSVRGNLVAVLTHLAGAPRDMAALAGAFDAFLTAGPEAAPAAQRKQGKARGPHRGARPPAEEKAGGGMVKYVAAGALHLQDDGTVTTAGDAPAAFTYDEDAERWRQR